jgi:YHS domain-containing protein
VAIDLVCGKTVNEAEAVEQGLTYEYKGKTYYFCSRTCKVEFSTEPKAFLT